jgi:hypothetical protein
MYRQHQEVYYQGNKAIIWLVLGCIDAADYIVKIGDGIFTPALEADLSETQL